MPLVQVCSTSDLTEGEIVQVDVAAVGKVAVYLVEGAVYATADTCTHGEASLAEDGYVEESRVICSWHDGAFDIRTGAPCALPCNIPLKTYEVVVDGDAVSINV